MKKLLYLLIITFILLNVINVNAQIWNSKQPLDARMSHTMSYIGDDKVIMFGGSGSSGYMNDTWLYDLSTDSWTQVAAAQVDDGTGPPPRAYHSMSYIGDDKVIMFGGFDDNGYLNDTWIFDLSDSTWYEPDITSATIPPSRFSPSISYIDDNKVMMFGGGDENGYYNDTWIFDLSYCTWTQSSISSSPAARFFHSMAYLGNYKVLLFGGSGDVSEFNDTWIYDYGTDGTDDSWSQDNIGTGPSNRSSHIMSYIGDNKVLLFGGLGYSGMMNDTWTYDFSNVTDGKWTQNETGSNPSSRTYHSMAYIGNKKVLMFGGFDKDYFMLNDSWIYEPTLALVTTNAITNITSKSAISGGNVANDGGAEVTGRGVCWNTSGSPTIADNSSIDGTGIGSFTSSMNGLTESTTYFVCAYATNSVGTAYGEIISFVTKSIPTIVCTSEISLNADINSCTVSNVDLGTPSLSDNSPVANIKNDAPSEFRVGTTVVNWTLSDIIGNTYSCSQNVIVTDITYPTVITKNISVILSKGSVSITAKDIDNGSYDVCGIKSIALSNVKPESLGKVESVLPSTEKITFDCKSIGDQKVSLIVIDNNGNSVAGEAVVTVQSASPLSIVDNPSDVSTCEDQPVSFFVNATGDGLSYQWRRNTVNIEGANSNSFSISSVIADDAGLFDVVVTDYCGQSMTSSQASLSVNTEPEITLEPISKIVLSGADVSFIVEGTGIPTPTIQWQKSTDKGTSWTNVVGATAATLTIKNVSMKQNMEMYHAVFSNSCGTIASQDASLQLKLVLNEIGPVELCMSTQSDDKKWKHHRKCSPHHRKCDHRINIKVELFKNGTSERNKIMEGEIRNQQGHGHESEKHSTQYTIPLPNLKNITFAANDYLYCKISVKRNKNGKDFPVRMWFNGAPHSHCQPVNKSWSRLHKVTVGGNTKNFYYFRWSEADILPLISSPGDKIKYIEVKATENYKEIETWRIMGSSMKELISAEDESTDEATNSDNDAGDDHNRLQSELDAFELFPNYPNPFTDGTVIKYTLNQESDVALNFYDGAGRLIENAVSSRYTKGTYYYTFYPRDNSSGYYVCVLTCNGVSKVVNLKLIK